MLRFNINYNLKRNLLNITLFSFVLSFSVPVLGQTKIEKERLEYGNKAFDKRDYLDAISHFQYLVSINNDDPDYNFKYGACLIYQKDIKKAFKHLSYALENNVQDKRVYYFLGKLSHLNYSFNTAINYYNDFKSTADSKVLKKYQVDNEIQKCREAKNLMKNYSELKVYSKRRAKRADFYRSYETSRIGGKVIISDEFQTKVDKKKDHHPVIFLSNNQKYIFYASYGDKESTGKDIYMRTKLIEGGYSDAVKLSDNINSPFDEDYAYLSADGKTLYFSSTGHKGLGGYDIFKVDFDPVNNSSGTPINLDFKINSPDDDLFYIADEAGEKAYFASGRESDINHVNVYDIGVTSYPLKNVIIAGEITGNLISQDTELKIEAIDGDGGSGGDRAYVKNTENQFLLSLPKGGNYRFKVSSRKSKQIVEANIDVPFSDDLTPLKLVVDYNFENEEEKITIIKRFEDGVSNQDEILASYYRKVSSPQVNPNFDPEANEQQYDKSFVNKKIVELINTKEKEQLRLKGQSNFAKENAVKSLDEAKENQELAQEAIDRGNYEEAQKLQVKADNAYKNAKSYATIVSKTGNILNSNENILEKAEDYSTQVEAASDEQLKEISNFINENQKDNLIANIFQKDFNESKEELTSTKKDIDILNSALSEIKIKKKSLEDELANTNKRKKKKVLQDQIDELNKETAELESQRNDKLNRLDDIQEISDQNANNVLVAGQVSMNEESIASNVNIEDVIAGLSEFKQNSKLIDQSIADNASGTSSSDQNSTEKDTSNSSSSSDNDTSENIVSNVIDTTKDIIDTTNLTDTSEVTNQVDQDSVNRVSDSILAEEKRIQDSIQEVEKRKERIIENVQETVVKQETKLKQTQQQSGYTFKTANLVFDSLKQVEKSLARENDPGKKKQLEEEKKRLSIKAINYANLLEEYKSEIGKQNDDLAKGQELMNSSLNNENEDEFLQYLENETSSLTMSQFIDKKIDQKQSELDKIQKQLNQSNSKINLANDNLDRLNGKLAQENLTSDEKKELVREITQASREIEDIGLSQKALYNKSNVVQNQIIGLIDQQNLVDYMESNPNNSDIANGNSDPNEIDQLVEKIDKEVDKEYITNPEENVELETFSINSEIAFLTKMDWVQSSYENLVDELDKLGDEMEVTPKTDRKYAELKNKAWLKQNNFFEKNFQNQLQMFESKSQVATESVENAENIKEDHLQVKSQAEQFFKEAKNTRRLDEKNELFKKAFTLLNLQEAQLDSLYDVAAYNEYGLYVDKSKEDLKKDVKILEEEHEGLIDEVFDLTKKIDAERDQSKRNELIEIKIKKEILARNKKRLINDIKKLIEDKEYADEILPENQTKQEKQYFEARRERDEILFDYINNSEWANPSDADRIKSQYEDVVSTSKKIEELFKQKRETTDTVKLREIHDQITGLTEKLYNKENILFSNMLRNSAGEIKNNNKEITELLKEYYPNADVENQLAALQNLIKNKVGQIDSLKNIETDDKFELSRLKREIFKLQNDIAKSQNEVLELINNNPSENPEANTNTQGGVNEVFETNFGILVDSNGTADYDVNDPVSSEQLKIISQLNESDPDYQAFLKQFNVLMNKLNAAEQGSDEYKRIKLELVELENAFLMDKFYERFESFNAKATYSPVAQNAFSKNKLEMIKHEAEELFLDAKNTNDLAIKNNILKQAFLHITKYELQVDSIERVNAMARRDGYKKLSDNAIDGKIGDLQQEIFDLMNEINALLEKYDKETDPYKRQELLREKKRKAAELNIKQIQIKELNRVIDERNGVAVNDNNGNSIAANSNSGQTNANSGSQNQEEQKKIKAEIDEIQEKTQQQIEELKSIQTELEAANNDQQALLDKIGKTEDPDEKKELYEEYQNLKALIAELQAKLDQIKEGMEESANQLANLQNQLTNLDNTSSTGRLLVPTGASNDPASFTSVSYVNQFKTSSGETPASNTNTQKFVSGLVFKVQIGAFYKPVSEENFREFTPITYLRIPGSKYVRYYAGKFSQFSVANKAKNIIRTKKGYADAFVVAFYNGQKVSVSKARQLEKGDQNVLAEMEQLVKTATENGEITSNGVSNGNTTSNTTNNTSSQNSTTISSTTVPNSLFFTVQIGALRTNTPGNLFNGINDVYSAPQFGGFVRFNSGKFSSRAAASGALASIRNVIPDAFVVAYYKGSRISLTEAQKLLSQYGNDILIK